MIGPDVETTQNDIPLYKKSEVTKAECTEHLNSFVFKAKDQSLYCYFYLTRTAIRKSLLACKGE